MVTVEKILESIEDVEYIRKLQDLYFVETKDGCKTCRGYVVHPNGDISDFSFAMIGFDKLETYLNAEVVYDSSINAIKHHGVKGMKWGIHKQYGSYPRKSSKDFLDSSRSRKLSDMKDSGIIGVVATVAFTVVPFIVATIKKNKSDKKRAEGTSEDVKLIKSQKQKSPKINSKSDCIGDDDVSVSKALNKVNPKNGDNNCVYCSVAYNLVRKGYEIRAPITNPVSTIDVLKKIYKIEGGDSYLESHCTTYQKFPLQYTDVIDAVSKTDSTSGVVSLGFRQSNIGHCIAYEKIGDKIELIDAQSKKRSSVDSKYFKQMFKMVNPLNSATVSTSGLQVIDKNVSSTFVLTDAA